MGRLSSNACAVAKFFLSRRTIASSAPLKGKKKMESTLRRLKALLSAIYSEVDLARNDLVYRDHQETHDALSNAQELIGTAKEVIIEELGDDYDIEELNFDGSW
jgi:hypothetical protein